MVSSFKCRSNCIGSWEKSTAAGRDKQCPGWQDPAGGDPENKCTQMTHVPKTEPCPLPLGLEIDGNDWVVGKLGLGEAPCSTGNQTTIVNNKCIICN